MDLFSISVLLQVSLTYAQALYDNEMLEDIAFNLKLIY